MPFFNAAKALRGICPPFSPFGLHLMTAEPSALRAFSSSPAHIPREHVNTRVVSQIPEGFSFNQSTSQAFYFIEDVVVNGEPIQEDDWLIAEMRFKIMDDLE